MLKGILNARFSLAQGAYTSRNIPLINIIFFLAATAQQTWQVMFL